VFKVTRTKKHELRITKLIFSFLNYPLPEGGSPEMDTAEKHENRGTIGRKGAAAPLWKTTAFLK